MDTPLTKIGVTLCILLVVIVLGLAFYYAPYCQPGYYPEGMVCVTAVTGTKAAWALQNWPELEKARAAGRLAAGTIDSYLIARLSGGAVHATEPSNASRTLCFHLTRHEFDDELCRGLGVPREIWPEVRPSAGTFALTKGVPGLPDGIPITGVLGAAAMNQSGEIVGSGTTWGTRRLVMRARTC